MSSRRGIASEYSYIKMKKEKRVFMSAILASVLWHVFWLSMITVVVVPNRIEPIKFSKVSFLGPILERTPMELGIKPVERSSLEMKYLSRIDRIDIPLNNSNIAGRLREETSLAEPHSVIHSNLTDLIEQSLSGSKIEPVRIAE